MDLSFESENSLQDSSILSEEMEQDDDLDIFENQGNEKKDWRKLLEGGEDDNKNQFHMNSKDELLGDLSQSRAEKSKKTPRVSEEKLSLKAYHYLIKVWFLNQIIRCARRSYNSSLSQRENTGKLLSAIGVKNVVKLVEARGKRPQQILQIIQVILNETNFRALPNLIQRTIYLLNFCQVECRILTLVNFQNFNLFDRFKIRNQKKAKVKRGIKARAKQFVKYVEESSQSESQSSRFDDLEKYNYMSKKYVDHFIEKGQRNDKQTKYNFRLKGDKNFYLRPNEWLQVYNDKNKTWKSVNLDSFVVLTDNDVKKSVEGISTVFIYSCKILNTNPDYSYLFSKRAFKNIQIMDQTIRFSDGLIKNRKRIGGLDLREIMQKMIRYAEFNGPDILLNKIEHTSRKSSLENIENIISLNYFPTTLYQFSVSKFYVIPSQIPKFEYLPQTALPLPNIEFNGQKVFSRKSLVAIHSRYGWVDVGRMVKTEEIGNPKKQTLTRQKKQLKLYSFDQTVKFQWNLVDGKFQKNEFNNAYINQYTPPPPGIIIIPENVGYVCKKYNHEFVRVIQGFKNGHPHEIGFAIFQKEKEQILEQNIIRIQELAQRREKSKLNNLISFWKQLCKAVIVKDDLVKKYQTNQVA